MITLDHITLAHGSNTLVRDASATVPRGALTALVGRNGSGKSTLLRVVAGLERPAGGKVMVNGLDVHRASARTLAQTLAMVTTERVRVMNLLCRDVVAMGRAPHTSWTGRLSAADRRVVDAAMERVGVTRFADRTLLSLSDGEAQRVMLARALAQDTPVILLDEPTSFLDVPGRVQLVKLLAALAAEGKTILYSTHELDLAMAHSHLAMSVADGNIRLLPPGEIKLNFCFEADV